MKRKTRKRLKKDEFVTTVTKVFHFIRNRKREILTVCGLVVIGIAVFLVARIITGQSLKRENVVLAEILELSSDLARNPENVEKLENLAGGGRFSRLAYLALARHWIENGELEKAQSCLLAMPEKRKDVFYFQAMGLLALTCAEQEQYDEAIKIYRMLEEEKSDDYPLDVVLFQRAEVHEKKGEVEKALEVYKRIQEEYPQTYYGFDASQKARKLETKN